VPEPAFLDTFFIVALINPRDPHHARAAGLAREFRRRPIVTTDAVLLESGNTLARGYKREAVAVLRELRSSNLIEVVPLTSALLDEALAMYGSTLDKGWGLVDCVSFAVMRQRHVSDALTSDRHFIQAGFRALLAD